MQGVYLQGGGSGAGNVQQGQEAETVQVLQAVNGRTFYSVDAVLKWAFDAAERNGAKVANYKPCTSAATGGGGLDRLETRAQAACVIARVDRLPPEQRSLVLALYAWNSEGQQSIDWLCGRSRSEIDRGPALLIEALVIRHCRQVRRIGSEPLKVLAVLHGVPYGTVRRREELVRAWLGRAWLEAENALWRDWVKGGLIQP